MKKAFTVVLIVSLMFFMSVSVSIRPVSVRGAGSILIYGPSFVAAPVNEQTLAEAAGFTVTIADASTWAGMTASQFSAYNAIVFCDPMAYSGPSALDVADANKAVWSSIITGPIIVLGTDPEFHVNAGEAMAGQLITNGITFAASGSGTGLYACLSAYWYDAGSGTPVSFLSEFGTFTVMGAGVDYVHIVDPTHPAMAGLTDAGLSNWETSVHEYLQSYPSSFVPLADAGVSSTSSLLPYIIASEGSSVVSPVGGEIIPVNALQLMAPYLAVALVAAAAIGFTAKYKRRIP